MESVLPSGICNIHAIYTTAEITVLLPAHAPQGSALLAASFARMHGAAPFPTEVKNVEKISSLGES